MKLAVIICHFNPAGYSNPRRNLLRFMRQMEAEGVPVFVAELAYEEAAWLLPEAPNILRLRASSSDVMWHKENLLNLVEKIVPEEFDALAWIDADVWFQRLDWLQATEEALQKHAVVQLFDKVALTSMDGCFSRFSHGAGYAGNLSLSSTTPGFAWAARRSLWREAGGLFDRAVIGGGDMLQASVWLPTAPLPYEWLHYKGVPESLERLKSWCAENGGCGGVEGTIWHEWHGDTQNRRYVERHGMMKELDITRQLVRREDGLLEFCNSVPKSLRSRIYSYFETRAEDGNVENAPASRERRQEREPEFKTRTDILNWLIEWRGYGSYLEIGVGDGSSFAGIRCARKESVDPAEGQYEGAQPTHRMTSDVFFAQNEAKYDVIFIDGLHHTEVVERDLKNALAALNLGGAVVCHDLNPSSEAMQAVPRVEREWTGDCWKAWVKLRCERDDLFFAVTDIDYGVGVILTAGVAPSARLVLGSEALDWRAFARHRGDWLPLVAPGKFAEALGFPMGDDESFPLTVVTLWRPDGSETQQAVMDYLLAEHFPARSRFVWTVEAGCSAAGWLESQLGLFERRGCGFSMEMMETGMMPHATAEEKHATVAALYNDALGRIRSDMVFTVEDDVVPQVGTFTKLCCTLASEPRVAAVMGAYRTRQRHDRICAGALEGDYLSWSLAGQTAVFPASWVAAGLTLYRAKSLRKCLPASPEKAHEGWVKGWDMVVSQRLKENEEMLMVDAECVAEHRFGG